MVGGLATGADAKINWLGTSPEIGLSESDLATLRRLQKRRSQLASTRVGDILH